MGSIKLEQRGKVEQDEKRGLEINENLDTKIGEAEISREALDRAEASVVDDDMKAAVDAGRTEADGLAKSIAESDGRAPGMEVTQSLKETASENKEYAETERAAAEAAGEMTGDFADTGANLAGQIEASADEFGEIADLSEQMSEDIQADIEARASRLENAF